MSQWHALEGVVHGGESLPGIEVRRWPRELVNTDRVALSDGLSDPDGDELNRVHVALLPRGAAWATPDDIALQEDTWLWKFWRAVTEVFVDAYRDMWGVAMASTSISIIRPHELADWEREYGLPNPCLGTEQTEAERYKWLRFKVLSKGTITPGDFLNLAAEAGHEIVIEEPEMFEFGRSDCGGACELGSPEMEHLVIVWPIASGEYGFEFGDGTFAESLLYNFDGIDELECLLPDLVSSGFLMLFNYNYLNQFPPQ